MAQTHCSRDRQVAALELWWQQIHQWRDVHGGRYHDGTPLLKPQYVIEQVSKITNGDAFVCSDVGQHQMFAAQYYQFNKPNRWINSGGLGTMGFGLPAAMGVKLNYPDADVVCVTGEGSIQMNIQELSTCKQYGLGVKIINLNNGYLGMVKAAADTAKLVQLINDARRNEYQKLATANGLQLADVELLIESNAPGQHTLW